MVSNGNLIRRPDPVSEPPDGLVEKLRRRMRGEVCFDVGERAAYAMDASNYRQVPLGSVLPETVDDAVAAIAVCRDHRGHVVSRGGGASLAGQTTNRAVVIDWTRFCHRLVSVDTSARTCVVEPGIALDELNRQLAGDGLMLGPKPATHRSCTIGSIIGNNSCGSTAQANGKTAGSTVPKSWPDWADPRLVVLVLQNNDLSQVTWELRAMGGSPEFLPSPHLPEVDCAGFATSLGLDGLTVDEPERVEPAWDGAPAARRPCVIVFRTDPAVPPIPPPASWSQITAAMEAILRGDSDRLGIIKEGVKSKLAEVLPGRGA